ncbi:MAG: ribonuclease III [Prevotellaceae bacterium]|nr:ribonuclease III [Prevotellaceae bacterium]
MINFIDKLKLPFRKDKELFSSLYSILGFYPRDIAIYKQALSHSSNALQTESGKRLNNERLEFLGDAIIEAVTSDIVYRHFDKKREGFLTTTRSKLVQRDTLNKMAQEVGLDKLVRTGGHQSGHNSYIGGNAFEAIVGAVYLDRGYKYCMWFLKSRIIAAHLNLNDVAKKEVNFKSKLLEWAQRNRLGIEFISNDPGKGAATSETPTFLATVMIENVECGKGNGFSKKESHQNAARETLIMLNANKQKIAEILKSKEQRTAMEAELISVPPRVSDGKRHSRPKRRNSAPQRAQNGVRENVVADTKTPQVNALLQSAKACTDNIGLTTNNEPPVSSGGENEKGNRKCNYNNRRRKQARDAADNAQTRQKSRDAIIAEAENKAFNK